MLINFMHRWHPGSTNGSRNLTQTKLVRGCWAFSTAQEFSCWYQGGKKDFLSGHKLQWAMLFLKLPCTVSLAFAKSFPDQLPPVCLLESKTKTTKISMPKRELLMGDAQQPGSGGKSHSATWAVKTIVSAWTKGSLGAGYTLSGISSWCKEGRNTPVWSSPSPGMPSQLLLLYFCCFK